jgi:hypothetical protein
MVMELKRQWHALRNKSSISYTSIKRAEDFIFVLPADFPVGVVRLLANESVLLYWNKANFSGYERYEALELRVEILPSLKIYYDWEVTPAPRAEELTKGSGLGIIRANSHVNRVIRSSARYAIQAFMSEGYVFDAPLAAPESE